MCAYQCMYDKCTKCTRATHARAPVKKKRSLVQGSSSDLQSTYNVNNVRVGTADALLAGA